MKSVRQSIERLDGLYPNLFLQPHMVAAVSVLSDYSKSPANLVVQTENLVERVTGEGEFQFELSWKQSLEAKAERLRATMQRKPLVELAATAISLMTIRVVFDLGEVDVTAYGDRADFLAVDKRCVLEISGTEVAAEFNRRHREKVKQAATNPLGWDAYVVVCLFSTTGHRVRIARHEYRGDSND